MTDSMTNRVRGDSIAAEFRRWFALAEALEGRFEIDRNAYEQRRGELADALRKTRAHFKEMTAQPVGQQSELTKLLGLFLRQCAEGTAEFAEIMEREVHEARFENRFRDTLNVLVYGTVNCGKSTLGNFLAGLNLPEDLRDGADAKQPVIFRYDEHAAEESLEKLINFEERETECTRTIQGFRIGGLTWIDTPGIHSVTIENQELAKRFADHADLVVYLVSSDSPLRQGDARELRERRQEGKPLLVVVTKCDVREKQFDAERNCIVTLGHQLKPEKNRQEQREHIEKELRENDIAAGLSDSDLVFTSTIVAREAIEAGDAEKFHSSGFPALVTQMERVLAPENATYLKEYAPNQRLSYVIDQVLGTADTTDKKTSIGTLQLALRDNRKEVGRKREELRGLPGQVARRASARAMNRINDILQQAENAYYVDNEVPDVQEPIKQAIQEAVEYEVSRSAGALLQATFENLNVQLQEIAGLTGADLAVVREEMEIPTEELAKGRGAVLGGGAGAVIGGVIGTLLGAGPIGGTIGAMVGGAVGGWLGEKTGEFANQKMGGTRTITHEKGLNTDDVRARCEREIPELMEPQLRKAFEKLEDQVFAPLDAVYERVERELESLVKTLESKRPKLG